MADQFNMDITSANAEAVLSADEIFPNGITLQQFSTDQSFAPESQQLAETRMGVDGFLAARGCRRQRKRFSSAQKRAL